MAPSPCPTAKALEDMFYPGIHDIINAVCTLVAGHQEHGMKVPEKQSMTDFYKHFRGPF
jgi:pyruvate dehydrogenase E1 component beta subunit